MSDEVSQFLEQVERLRGQQIEEDEVRARELEEYLAAKRERQARREERARSISPQKSSPANTPSPRSSYRSVHLSDALKLESPGAVAAGPREDSAEPDLLSDAVASSSPTKEDVTPGKVDPKLATMSNPSDKGSPLSWQRRPNSRGGIRPLSMVAAQNATQRSLAASPEAQPQSATEATFSRDQIAQALGSKDPAWFRQTADRGQGSAAYRKTQVEDDDVLDMSSTKAQLPGLSQGAGNRSASQSGATTPIRGALASPPPLSIPRHDDDADENQTGAQSSATPTGRTSPTRPASPTKGMGGFVQSAMMKRSDSVKRWSVTSPPGLARADSIASNRSGFDRGTSQATAKPRAPTRENTATPTSSRPTSRHGEQESSQLDDTPKASEQERAPEPAVEPANEDNDASLPVSPSKTMDPRRWSPTKPSWLESALNKPEAPKPQSKPASPAQPAWRVEFNKNKTESANSPITEAGRAGSISHRHQVSIGGLMRSTPMGTTSKTNTTGLGGIYSPPPNANRPAFGHGGRGSVSFPASRGPEVTGEEPQASQESQESQGGVGPEKRGAPISKIAPAPKPKPETPPKKDFRSTLKQRPAEGTATKSNEPEFKNVFGNLRRTKTQNYVAPDELKTNILRGKAALNQTDGPQKSERKDDFREAILKKKEDFKKAQAEGKGVTRTSSSATETSIPEGLARRAELGKSLTGSKPEPAARVQSPVEPSKASSPKPIPGPKRVPSQPVLSPKSPSTARPLPTSPELKKIERVSTESDVPEPAAREPRPIPSLHKEKSAPSRLQQQSPAPGGKLADRFNPALAGLLARGPPPVANGGKSSEETKPQTTGATDTTAPTATGPQLTHMTKGRARGPKRKAPSAAAAAPSSKQSSSEPAPSHKSPPTAQRVDEAVPSALSITKAEPPKPQGDEALPARQDDVLPLREAEKPAPLSIQQQVAAKASIRGKPSPVALRTQFPEEERTTQPSTPSYLRRRPTSPDKASADPPSPLKPHKTGDAPGSPRKLDLKRMSKFLDESSEQSNEPAREPIKLTHQRTGSRSPVKVSERPLPQPPTTSPQPREEPNVGTPIKSPVSAQGKASTKSPPLKPKPSFDRLSQSIETPKAAVRSATRPLPIPPVDSSKVTSPLNSPMRSPSRHGVDVSKLLSDFFGPERPRNDFKVDPAEILMSAPPADAKVKSLGVQLHQLSGDGKKIPVPPHFERVLFDQEMYICAHEFAYSPGKTIFELYFWIGDEVSESAAQDAQLFAQREARALGGKLIKLRQGKETSEFLQALGGVVITRRGSSNRHDSLASSILCGRRYLGQITFDEVEFATTSLCAGFPYLINKGGKCYLWKGKGSDVDELSCARLVGMELTLTGELTEYEDGVEPASFWELFDGGLKPHSADHWRLKPNYSKYCSRLFCSDADSRQQIFELRPFTQADLSPVSVYVLDAFFEIYIIVGARAQPQYASFRNALDFAQEYAILAAGMEDRPFVPISTVVLEGIPRDMKSVFRKWTDTLSPTITNPPSRPSAGLKRKKSLKLVPLTQALQVLKD